MRWPAARRLVGALLLAAASLPGQSLTPPQQRGKEIYLTGLSPSGRTINAALPDSVTEVPATVLRCVNCHGRDGKGRPEGAVTPADIRWETLTRSYAAGDALARRHPAYTENTVRRAVTMGIDSAGNLLEATMPKYRFAREDLDDLVAYLQIVSHEAQPGLTPTNLRLGVILPPAGASHLGSAVEAALRGFADSLNGEGGIFNRRLEFRFMTAPEAAGERAATAGLFARREDLFAFVAADVSDAEAEFEELAGREQLPVVGAISLRPGAPGAANRYVFYIDGGLPGRCGALLAQAGTPPGGAARLAILRGGSPEWGSLTEVLAARWTARGHAAPPVVNLGPGLDESRKVVETLAAQGIDTVMLLSARAADVAFIQAAAAKRWSPAILIPAPLGGAEVLAAAEQARQSLVFALPNSIPSRESPQAQKYDHLARRYHLPPAYRAEQALALAAAEVTAEALRRAGADLNREKLVEALEQLRNFDTGLGGPVTFSPERRVGSVGAALFAVEPAKRSLILLQAWMDGSLGAFAGR